MALEPRIYLASRSPRRRELLHQIHVNFELLLFRTGPRADVELSEDPLPGELAPEYVRRIARAKAVGAAARIQSRRMLAQPVLAADTTIDLDGQIIGKPVNADDACAILRALSGRRHKVLTAVALALGERVEEAFNENQVRFRSLGEDEIRRYVASGEPLDKAGAYALQGEGRKFVTRVIGSETGVIGLPMDETLALLREAGFAVRG
jgi:septum formation protein